MSTTESYDGSELDLTSDLDCDDLSDMDYIPDDMAWELDLDDKMEDLKGNDIDDFTDAYELCRNGHYEKLPSKIREAISKFETEEETNSERDNVSEAPPRTASNRSIRRKFDRYMKRMRKTSHRWFREYVRKLKGYIRRGDEKLGIRPFKFLKLENVDAMDLINMAKKDAEHRKPSPQFEELLHKELTCITEPTVVMDKNGIVLCVYVTDIRWPSHAIDELHNAMSDLKFEDSGGKPTAKDVRNKRKEHAARQWVYTYIFEQGHNYRGPVFPKDSRSSASQVRASLKFLDRIGGYSDFLSALVYIFDKKFWERARNVCDTVNLLPEGQFFITSSFEVFLNTMMIENKTSTTYVGCSLGFLCCYF